MEKELIIWTPLDYTIIFILAFLPLAYKLLFWLYTIQLKEYRWDRFREYLWTKQWKKAIFNVFFVIDIILLLYSISIYLIYLSKTPYYIVFWGTFYNMFFWYLVILNIFVIWKIIRKNILKPVFSSRLTFLLSIFIIIQGIDLYMFYYLNSFNYTYIYILTIFIALPLIIFLYNFISLPLVNYSKNKIINKAISKSLNTKNTLKVAITWSYWKSSIKEMLSCILEQDSKTLKTPENINTELWVSKIVINKLNDKYKFFVAEIWAYKIWEISLLWKIVNHKHGFLTAIWNQHIWIFWTQQNIIKGKSEISESVMKNKWTLYVNGDDKNIKKAIKESIINEKKINLVRYWMKDKNLDIQSEILGTNDWFSEFKIHYKNKNYTFKCSLVWEHNILNLTWVIAFCLDIWIKQNDLKKYLKNISLPENRLWVFKNKSNILINDSYNLPIEWLLAWINILGTYKWNKVLVMDDVLELWKYSKKIHFELWQKIAKKKEVNQIFYCGVNYWKYFLDWILEAWFKEDNILENMDNIKNSTILFEWRWSRIYFDKFRK